MNYYTLLPNYCQGFNSTPAFSYPHPQQKIDSVLTILSQALKFSVGQYSGHFIPTTPKNEALEMNHVKKCELQRQQTVQKFEQEENILIAQNTKVKEKQNIKYTIANLSVCGQRHNQNSSHTITNDQILSENLLGSPQKENDDFSIISKKQKIRVKKHSFHVFVPQVCLIQTAQAVPLQFGREQLMRKKQSLLNRQVQKWNQKMKNRRDKREIRMLNK